MPLENAFLAVSPRHLSELERYRNQLWQEYCSIIKSNLKIEFPLKLTSELAQNAIRHAEAVSKYVVGALLDEALYLTFQTYTSTPQDPGKFSRAQSNERTPRGRGLDLIERISENFWVATDEIPRALLNTSNTIDLQNKILTLPSDAKVYSLDWCVQLKPPYLRAQNPVALQVHNLELA